MIVSNSSTLILLAKISLLRKFLDHSPLIIIPEEVKEEILVSENFDAKLLQKEIENKRIVVKKSNIEKTRNVMKNFHLDIGEAAAFSIFDRNEYSAILTDDGELIKLCKIEKINFLCAMTVVASMNKKNIISKEEAIDKINKLDHLGRYSKKIYEYYINEVEKNGNNVNKN